MRYKHFFPNRRELLTELSLEEMNDAKLELKLKAFSRRRNLPFLWLLKEKGQLREVESIFNDSGLANP